MCSQIYVPSKTDFYVNNLGFLFKSVSGWEGVFSPAAFWLVWLQRVINFFRGIPASSETDTFCLHFLWVSVTFLFFHVWVVNTPHNLEPGKPRSIVWSRPYSSNLLSMDELSKNLSLRSYSLGSHWDTRAVLPRQRGCTIETELAIIFFLISQFRLFSSIPFYDFFRIKRNDYKHNIICMFKLTIESITFFTLTNRIEADLDQIISIWFFFRKESIVLVWFCYFFQFLKTEWHHLNAFLTRKKANWKNLVQNCFNPIGQSEKRYAFYSKRKTLVKHNTLERNANNEFSWLITQKNVPTFRLLCK